jgi:hypothetical protein
MDDRIVEIRRKVAAGGKRLGAPLAEGEVARFESEHGIRLPEAYRRFLLEVGNGGDGPPEYGLEPLGDGPSTGGRSEQDYWTRLPDITRPFPFTRRWIWEADEETDEGTDEEVGHGSLYLGTDGCGMNWHLIVTGPERGHLWMLTGEGIQPTVPRRDFLSWYSDWLDGTTSEEWWGEDDPDFDEE